MQSLSEKATCPVCLLPFTGIPKVLPGCLHAFCLPCLNNQPITLESCPARGESPASETNRCGGKGSTERGEDPGELASQQEIQHPSPSRSPSPSCVPDSDGKGSASSHCSNPSPSLILDLVLMVNCPKCNRTSSIPPGGFEKMRASHVISNLSTTYKALLELQRKLTDVNEAECDKCLEASPANSYCFTCQHLLCEDHCKCHTMWKEFTTHKFFPIEALSSDSEGQWDSDAIKLLTPSLQLGELKCPRHGQKGSSNTHKFFCCTCEELACSQCTVSTHKDTYGHDHSCVSITPKMVSEKKESISGSLEKLNDLIDKLDDITNDMKSQADNVKSQARGVKDRIEAVFTEVIDNLQSRKISLCQEVDSRFSDSMKKFEDCSKQADTLKKNIMESRKFVEEHLRSRGDLGLLSVAGVISDHVGTVQEEYSQLLALGKVNTPKIKFTEDRDLLYSSISVFGSVHNERDVSPDSHRSSPLTASMYQRLQRLRYLPPLSLAPLSLSLQGGHSHPAVTAAACADMLNSDLLVGSCVCPAQPNLIPSPFETLASPIGIKMAGVHVRNLGGLSSPSGIRINQNFQLVVCEFGTHLVTTFDLSGKETSRLGEGTKNDGQFKYPQSTACDNAGKMLVVDSCDRIQMFDKDGKFLMSVGVKGKGQLQFADPASVVISPEHEIDKKVFVCERGNHRIQVLNKELAFHSFIGKHGQKEGEFCFPSDIAIDNRGHIYVADSGNNRIQVLTQNGGFVCSFGKRGSDLGELFHPSHVCVNSEAVFVSEVGNHRVSIFTHDGVFVSAIGRKGTGQGEFLLPLGVAVDQNRCLYVCDSKNNRIQIFK